MTYHSGNQLVDSHLVLEKAHVRPGMHMADLGCGRTGHIVFPAATAIGEQGVVYAVDIMKDVLENINKRAGLEGFLNIHTVWADIERRGAVAIPEKSLDLAIFVNSLFHAKDVSTMLNEANRLLKDKARLVIVDWKAHGLPFGPRADELLDFIQAKSWAIAHNFVIQDEFEVGRYHRGIVLYKHE